MSAPRRLPPARLLRIGGWTAVATAGAAGLLARFPLGSAAPAVAVTETPVSVSVPAPATAGAALPTAPESGLLVLYLSETPGVPVLSPTAAPAAPPAASPPPVPAATVTTTATTVTAPPTVTSSGS